MASTARTPQVPQHVTTLLSHLTSRPGVQSTLILSRKDGSIIQSTGQLAQPDENGTSVTTHTPSGDSHPLTIPPSDSSPASPAFPQPYQPSQTETLAAHIFAFVSSASALGVSLSRPLSAVQRSGGGHFEDTYDHGKEPTPPHDDRGDGLDWDEDAEVKLLRMRTKKHEIVVVPDRKYLLCVVHDASASGTGATGSRR